MAEDDDDHFLITQKAFEESTLDLTLKRVFHGEELIQWLNHHEQAPSLILLDLNMPKMDGREVLQILSKHSQWSKIPIVVLTTSPNEEDKILCLQKGVKRYLQKPVRFQKIIDIMNSLKEFI